MPSPSPLTISAKPTEIVYGTNPSTVDLSNAYTITGFVNNETKSVLGGTLNITIDPAVTISSPAGIYPDAIKIQGCTAGNYEITYKTADLIIKPSATHPSVPAGLSAEALSATSVELTWNVADKATTYNIKRSTSENGTYTTIASSLTATTHTDTGLTANTTYYTYMFNLLQNKQIFITQLKTNSLGMRIIDEGAMDSDENMDYSEFVAILSGNNDLLEKAKLERKVMALESEHRSYNKQLDMTASKLNYSLGELSQDKERLVGIRENWRIIEEKLSVNDENIRPNLIRLNNSQYNDNLQAIGERLIEINKYKNTHGYFETIGSLLHFDILVKTEKLDTYQFNCFFIEGACKYSYNSGHLADTPELAASNFIRALCRIPLLIEKYETDNWEKEMDIAKMQDIVNTPWRKGPELKEMKIQMAVLERKLKNDLEKINNSNDINVISETKEEIGLIY